MTDSNARPTILLAEDEPAIRSLVEFALQRNGYSVLLASDGVEAVELSRQYPGTIDLLLSDVRMPRMDGMQAAQVIQRERPEIRVLLMSGESGCGVPPQLEAAMIRKPFLPMVLLERVRVLLAAKPKDLRYRDAALSGQAQLLDGEAGASQVGGLHLGPLPR